MALCVYLLQFVAFLDLLAVGLIVPLVPNHIRQLGGNHIYVGLLGSIYSGFQLGSGPLIGSLSDLKGRRTILMLTLLLCAVVYTIMGFTSSIAVILILRGMLGLFKQTQLLTKALVPDYESNQQKQSVIYGKMAAISGVGITLGPVIGGHIVEDHPENGFMYIAVIVGFCFLVNAGLVYFLPATIKKVTKERKANKEESVLNKIIVSSKQSVVELSKIPWAEYWDVFLLKALISFAMAVYFSNYSLYLKTIYELSPKYIGYVISIQGVISSVSSFFIGYINKFYSYDIDYSVRNLHMFILVGVSLTGMILATNVYMFIVCLLPLAVGSAVGRLVSLEMVLTRCKGKHRGTLIGATNSVTSLSGVVAPMVAGFIGQYFGVAYGLYASLFATLLGVALSYQYKRKSKIE
ncbi:PREDICTED: quinolone resistance protein NorA-like [Papilio polytes]|uniref:quinolone resistance protein NorA-like n=1 Tax=Papilio polytes TaxID=76194 RepID=UPI00067655A2|nr:PREDICTED: quinolone resistance protein NorA-like [Papilio polytes]